MRFALQQSLSLKAAVRTVTKHAVQDNVSYCRLGNLLSVQAMKQNYVYKQVRQELSVMKIES